jgi:hypothetical protein
MERKLSKEAVYEFAALEVGREIEKCHKDLVMSNPDHRLIMGKFIMDKCEAACRMVLEANRK